MTFATTEGDQTMELNAEQIKKALERNIRVSMALAYDCPRITYSKLKDALALINSQEQKIKELTEEKERLRASSIDYRNIPIIREEARADTARKMSALLNAQIDEITASRIELRAFPFAALLAERMKVIVADTAKKVEEGSV